MPPRPMPSFNRGPRRRRPAPATARLLACPVLDPSWELSAVGALLKPQTRAAIAHRPARQPWTPAHAHAARSALAAAADRLNLAADVAEPDAGDFHLVADLRDADAASARGVALALGRALPGHWFRLDRLFVRNATFHKRRRGYELELSVAHAATVPREVRSALRGLI